MDPFTDHPTTLNAPARDAAPIVPSDTATLSVTPRALYVGQGGNLALVMAGGQSVTFEGVPAGTLLPVRPQLVNATGTTAGALVALW